MEFGADLLTVVLCGAKNTADPGQVITGRRGGDAAGAPCAYMYHQGGCTEVQCVDLSDLMPFEVLERGLFGAAPGSETPKGGDVPADQRREAWAAKRPRRSLPSCGAPDRRLTESWPPLMPASRGGLSIVVGRFRHLWGVGNEVTRRWTS